MCHAGRVCAAAPTRSAAPPRSLRRIQRSKRRKRAPHIPAWPSQFTRPGVRSGEADAFAPIPPRESLRDQVDLEIKWTSRSGLTDLEPRELLDRQASVLQYLLDRLLLVLHRRLLEQHEV